MKLKEYLQALLISDLFGAHQLFSSPLPPPPFYWFEILDKYCLAINTDLFGAHQLSFFFHSFDFKQWTTYFNICHSLLVYVGYISFYTQLFSFSILCPTSLILNGILMSVPRPGSHHGPFKDRWSLVKMVNNRPLSLKEMLKYIYIFIYVHCIYIAYTCIAYIYTCMQDNTMCLGQI